GDEGLRKLYTTSKSATWRFCRIMGVPTKKNQSIETIAPLLFKFLETMYAKEIRTNVDAKKLLTIKAKEMAVCRKNGLGYFLPLGCLAGLWSYVNEDKGIEATQIQCQGRNDDECLFYSGPSEFLTSPINANDFETYEDAPGYSLMNKTVPINGLSLEQLINNYYFQYNSGLLEMWGERFFPFEVGYVYILEASMRDLGIESALYESSFDFYKKFAKHIEKKSLSFSDSLMCALGWGKISSFGVKTIIIQVEHYPWCKMFDKKGSFPLITGAISGLCSGIKDRDIKFKIKKAVLLDKLTLVLEEIN
ncbi:MAG: hypothetical protein ABIG39_04810, partial [Candidatus Micrarchaeota archaeon]